MKKIVVLTGAGISAESGIKTFRDSDGLWENHRVEDVATMQAWEKDRKLVLKFYNERRKQLLEVKPNAAHYALGDLEEKYDVTIITQNVDDLHERGGSTKVVHLHGELKKARSTVDDNLIYDIDGWEIKEGDVCEKGSQLRPHIVWFGEMVPMIEVAAEISAQADIYLIIGTSLNVYPAAGLIQYTQPNIPVYLIDPKVNIRPHANLTIIEEKAGTAVPRLVKELLEKA